MGGDNVFIKSWPFKPEEKAMLYWIDNPYMEQKKWFIEAYFKYENLLKSQKMDWATIHFLVLKRYYQNGNLNDGEVKKDSVIKDLNLSNIKFNIIEDFLEENVDGVRKKIKTKIFVGEKEGVQYRIPALEIIRGILCINRFLLNRVVEIDSLSKYFGYKYDERYNLYIDFFDEYESKLLTSENIRHIAWIITNENILKMFNQIGKNLWLERQIKYDFLFEEFEIKARISESRNKIRILEIIELEKKMIKARGIYYTSKYNKQYKKVKEPKKRKYKKLKESDDKTLDPKIEGAKNADSDFIKTRFTRHTYVNEIKIHKIKDGERCIRDKEDINTKTYEIENESLRTTADTGGLDTVKGIEYENIDDVQIKGELEEFIEILRILKTKPGVRSVEVLIKHLPEGKKGKKFAMLSDGESKRRYVVGKIDMNNTTYSLIEIERENRSLSMLLLYSRYNVDWSKIYLTVALGLVNKSGAWDLQIVNSLQKMDVYANRIRHASDNKRLGGKVEYIYNKLLFS